MQLSQDAFFAKKRWIARNWSWKSVWFHDRRRQRDEWTGMFEVLRREKSLIIVKSGTWANKHFTFNKYYTLVPCATFLLELPLFRLVVCVSFRYLLCLHFSTLFFLRSFCFRPKCFKFKLLFAVFERDVCSAWRNFFLSFTIFCYLAACFAECDRPLEAATKKSAKKARLMMMS